MATFTPEEFQIIADRLNTAQLHAHNLKAAGDLVGEIGGSGEGAVRQQAQLIMLSHAIELLAQQVLDAVEEVDKLRGTAWRKQMGLK